MSTIGGNWAVDYFGSADYGYKARLKFVVQVFDTKFVINWLSFADLGPSY